MDVKYFPELGTPEVSTHDVISFWTLSCRALGYSIEIAKEKIKILLDQFDTTKNNEKTMVEIEKMYQRDYPGFESATKKLIPISRRGISHTQYAEMIMEKYHFKTLTDNETLLIYDDGIYTTNAAEYTIKKECEKLIPECSSYMVTEVKNTIKRKSGEKRENFDSDNEILNCNNGLYYFEKIEFHVHTQKILSRSKIATNYDKNARQRYFVRFLKDCFPDQPNEITNILEEMASCLSFDIDLQKFFPHIGGGSNGKSILFKIIEALLGSENVSNISIHELQNSRFSASRLDGKRANLYADIESDELKHLGKFKQIVSRDSF